MPEALTQNLKLIGRYSLLRELRRDRHTVAYLALDPVQRKSEVLRAAARKQWGMNASNRPS